MIHTLNRSTNLLFQHFTDEQNSLLSFQTPTHFSDLTDNFYDVPPTKPMETCCAVGLIYALRLYYITHHRHTPNGFLPSCALYHQHLYKITKEIKSTVAALSLFPARTTFPTMPRFLNHALFEANLFPLPPDGSLNHHSVNRYRQKALAEFERATPYVIDYANSFRLDNEDRRSVALQTVQDIVLPSHFRTFSHCPDDPETFEATRVAHQPRSHWQPTTHGYVSFKLCYLFSNDHQAFYCSVGS
jgi:hypothetical protein